MKAIYVRVSTEEQAIKGYSLKDQLHECRKKAAHSITREYIDDGISGEFLDRPALERLRTDLKNGLIDEVICLDPDRLSRKLVNQLILTEEIEKRARLTFVNHEYEKTPEGRLFYQMKGAVSEYEKAKINERMSRGRRQKAREGKVVRDYRIYGYNYDKTTNSLVPHPYESEVVKLIFECFTGKKGGFKGINSIAKYLNEQKIPTKLGRGMWHRQVVRQIISNPVYTGIFLQNKWNCEGMLGNRYRPAGERIPLRKRPEEEWIPVPCPPLIDENTFIYAKELLKEARRRYAGKPKHEYLLSGLVRCGKCGNTMTGVKAKHWGKCIFEYCDLKNYAGAKNPGCGKRVKAQYLDDAIWNTVLNWLNDKDKIEREKTNQQKEKFDDLELARVEARLRDINRERQNIVDFVSRTQIDERTTAAFNKRLNELDLEEDCLEKKKSEIGKNAFPETKAQGNMLKEAIEHYFVKAPEEVTFKDKRELIRLLIKEIVVSDSEITAYGF